MYLNNDVTAEILSRLPVQSLLRFRRVCKSWCNIIDSSTFGTSRLHNHETLFLHFTGSALTILNADSGKRCNRFRAFYHQNYCFGWSLSITSVVNGLICIYETKIAYRHAEGPAIGIYNPFLDKIKILPLSPTFSSLNLNFEADWSRICIQCIGLGLDNATKDYKLVRLISIHKGPTFVEVYSQTTNTWRKLVSDYFNFADYNLYFLEEIKSSSKSGCWAHWRTCRQNEVSEYVILSFNMHNEVFETIPYPDFQDRREVIQLGSSRVFAKEDDGSFALFVYNTRHRRTLEVWELKDRCWTHVRDVNVVPLMQGGSPSWPWPRALWKRDVVVLIEYAPKRFDDLIFYNYYTERVLKSCEIPIFLYSGEILEYKCSLILP